MTALTQHDFVLEPEDMERLANLNGPFDEHLRQIELRLGVEIANRGNVYRVSGDEDSVKLADRVIHDLYDATQNETLNGAQISLRLSESGIDALNAKAAEHAQEVAVKVKRGTIRGRGPAGRARRPPVPPRAGSGRRRPEGGGRKRRLART